MSKNTRKIDRSASAQQGLFDSGLSEGSLDIILGLKQLMSRLIAACGKDRYIIAAEISRLTLRDLSKDMLDKITSSDAAYRPDAVMLLAFCHVVGSLEPFRYLLEPLGSDVLNPEDRDLIELARIQEQMKHLEAEKMRILNKRGLK